MFCHARLAAFAASLALSPWIATAAPQEGAAPRPNVLVVLADDLGYGDVGATGNPVRVTPHLDRLADESAWLTSFYVSPVCMATRAALLTGRYPHRVGVHGNEGRLVPGAVTLAERLRTAGYATGAFGRWQLGAHYPNRPTDQGFDESLISRGAFLRTLAPTPNDGGYGDPYLDHNGEVRRFEGHADDVVLDRCARWIEEVHATDRPFFAYVATFGIRRPFEEVPAELRAEAQGALANAGESDPEANAEDIADAYALVHGLDRGVGRLLARLDELELAQDTLVLFLSDNGPNGARWNHGWRGVRTDVYEGGVRSVFFARWPGHITPGERAQPFGCHLDVVPTVLQACGIEANEAELDGRSLLPLFGGPSDLAWAERTLTLQAHQGGVPSPYANFMVRSGSWKLVHAGGFESRERLTRSTFDVSKTELYELSSDPTEEIDRSETDGREARPLIDAYHAFAKELEEAFADRPPERIAIGLEAENPTLLTHENWARLSPGSGGRASWKRQNSAWPVRVRWEAGYDIELRFPPVAAGTKAFLTLTGDKPRYSVSRRLELPAGATSCTFRDVRLRVGSFELIGSIGEKRDRAAPVWQARFERELEEE